jgi:hypothetical protein
MLMPIFILATITLGVIFAFAISPSRWQTIFNKLQISGANEQKFKVFIFISSFSVLIFFALVVLRSFPNSADEYGYVFQAEMLKGGDVWHNLHPLQDFFRYIHIGEKEGRWFHRASPGWSMILAGFNLFHIPFSFVSPILGAFTLLAVFGLARLLYGAAAAFLSVLIIFASSFFIFNSSSFFTHQACSLSILLFYYFFYKAEKDKTNYDYLLSGAAIGIAFIIRNYTAFLAAIPVGLILLYKFSKSSFKKIFLLTTGSLFFFLFTGWYNYQITGDALLFPTEWIESNEQLGFRDGPTELEDTYGKGHTPALGLSHTTTSLVDLVRWSSVSVLLLWVFGLILSIKERKIHATDFVLPALIAGYFIWYSLGGNRYGPRFYYEGFPFAVIFVCGWVSDKIKAEGFTNLTRILAGLLLSGLFASFAVIPYLGAREHQVVEERMDLYDQAKNLKLKNAIVFISSGVGVERPMQSLDLTRNGVDRNATVLYVHDLGEKNTQLMNYYPNRKYYRYDREKDQVHGRITEISSN